MPRTVCKQVTSEQELSYENYDGRHSCPDAFGVVQLRGHRHRVS